MAIRHVLLMATACALGAGCTSERTNVGTTDNSAPKDYQRIALISHSLTDGGTWPYLMRQALAEAGRPEPYLINAAGGGDVAADSLRRFDWSVLQFKPDLAIFFIGADNVKHMTEAEYEAAMEEMITKVQAQGADVLLVGDRMLCPAGMEPSDMSDKSKVAAIVQAERAAMDAHKTNPRPGNVDATLVLRRLAQKHRTMLCDIRPQQVDVFAQGHWLWEADRLHLNFVGYRAVTRSILDALGYGSVAVPEKLQVRVLPGLVTPWQVRAAKPGEAPLDEKTVLQVKPDASWTAWALPETEPLDSWWRDQARQEGFAMSLQKKLGKASHYIGVATYKSNMPAKVYLNTGGNLKTVWLNGRKIFEFDLWNGYHAGTKRIPVDLQAGDNTIVVETGAEFAITITPGLLW